MNCSGCITSAESVLITLQSHTEVLNFLAANPPLSATGHRVPVLSISPQSLASLAATLASSSGQPTTSLADMLSRVKAFAINALGFEYVYDTTFARHISLLEHVQEFEERRATTASGNSPEMSDKQTIGDHSACCGVHGDGKCGKHLGTSADVEGDGRLPMLASACPGWVCYAEKAHGEMLPFLGRTKSPQAIMGTLVKGWLAQKWDKRYVFASLVVDHNLNNSRHRPEDVYHVTVMPCYDKKLEASRPDFFDEASNTREVDCVLTTGELALLIKEKGFDLSDPIPSPSTAQDDFPDLLAHPGTSSGSYLHSLLSHLISTSPVPLILSTASASATSKQNADSTEYILTDISGATVFRGATCYGFRNLQNIVRRVARDAGIRVVRGRAAGATKRGASQKAYDYVEVMACPGGCVNGGGQLPRPSMVQIEASSSTPANDGDGGMGSKWADRVWTREVERAYWDGREPVGDRFGLPTPPASPKNEDAKMQDDATPANSCEKCEGEGVCEPPGCVKNSESAAHTQADLYALRVLRDMCGVSVGSWGEKMDARGEEIRRKLFRTTYRAVESEVIGLGVKW